MGAADAYAAGGGRLPRLHAAGMGQRVRGLRSGVVDPPGDDGVSGAAPKDTMYEYVKNKRSEVKKTKKPYVYPADARVSSGRWQPY